MRQRLHRCALLQPNQAQLQIRRSTQRIEPQQILIFDPRLVVFPGGTVAVRFCLKPRLFRLGRTTRRKQGGTAGTAMDERWDALVNMWIFRRLRLDPWSDHSFAMPSFSMSS